MCSCDLVLWFQTYEKKVVSQLLTKVRLEPRWSVVQQAKQGNYSFVTKYQTICNFKKTQRLKGERKKKKKREKKTCSKEIWNDKQEE